MDINEELEWVCRPLGTAPLPIEEFTRCMDLLITEAEALPELEPVSDDESSLPPLRKEPGFWGKAKGKLGDLGQKVGSRVAPLATEKFEAIKQWLANAFQHYPKAREHLRKVNAYINDKYYEDPKGLMAKLKTWALGIMIPSLERRVTDMSLEAKTAKQLAAHLEKLISYGIGKPQYDDPEPGLRRNNTPPDVASGTPKGRGAYGGANFAQQRRKPAY